MIPSERISLYIEGLGGWRGTLLRQIRDLVQAAAPELVEEWKWDTPVWALKGNVLAATGFKNHVKINFFKGTALPDPHGLFNAGLEAKAMRSIDLFEGDTLPEDDFSAMVRQAAAADKAGAKKK